MKYLRFLLIAKSNLQFYLLEKDMSLDPVESYCIRIRIRVRLFTIYLDLDLARTFIVDLLF